MLLLDKEERKKIKINAKDFKLFCTFLSCTNYLITPAIWFYLVVSAILYKKNRKIESQRRQQEFHIATKTFFDTRCGKSQLKFDFSANLRKIIPFLAQNWTFKVMLHLFLPASLRKKPSFKQF